MEKAKWDSSAASRAREKGTESHSFSSLSQKGFLKMFRRASGSPSFKLGTINTSLFRGDEGVSSGSVGRSGLVLQGEELVWTPGAELGLWICDPPEDWAV